MQLLQWLMVLVWYNTVIMWMQCAFGLMPALENSEHTNEKLNNLIA